MPSTDQPSAAGTASTANTRSLVARGFTWIEDVAYVGLGVLLATSAVVMLGSAAVAFVHEVRGPDLPAAVIVLLDRLLLVLMIIELLYTVQVSFREHALVSEPFLIVGLVAATRRILVLTAELTGLQGQIELFKASMIELALLTVMVVALVVSLRLLGDRNASAVATRG